MIRRIASVFRRRSRAKGSNSTDYSDAFTRISVRITNAEKNSPEESSNSDTDVAPLNLLCSLARSWAWEAVAFRCQTNPEEADEVWTDHHGDCLLHFAALGRAPVWCVQVLLEVNPRLATVCNKRRQYPLHAACAYRAPGDVIQMILDAYPEAGAMQTDLGFTPLHFVCDYGCSPETLRILLENEYCASTVGVKDYFYMQSPLEVLNGRKNISEFHRKIERMRKARSMQRQINELPDYDDKLEDLSRLEEQIIGCASHDHWQKSMLLVVAEYTGEPLSGEITSAAALRSCLCNPNCPPSLQQFAILLYDQHLRIPDEEGNLPLHLAASSSRPSMLLELLEAYPAAATIKNMNGDFPFNIASKNRCMHGSMGMQTLIESTPGVTTEVPEDLLPWFLAKSNKPHVLFDVLRSCPPAFTRSVHS